MAVLVILLGLVIAAANVAVVALLTKGGLDANLLNELVQQQPAYVAALACGPILLSICGALLGRSNPAPAAPAESATQAPAEAEPAPPPKPTSDAALRLLALLQQEARFLDFLQEDIDGYSDDQVGAAVRSIHAGCRKALGDRLRLERIVAEEDGAAIQVEAGFDPARIRLTGKVTGEPPFRGTVEHGGWRASAVNLPLPNPEADNTILAPAEVEIA